MAGSISSNSGGLPLAKVKQQWPIFTDLGGRENQISMVKRALKNRANILLHGPEGCGKTMFAHAIANETAQPFYELSGKDLTWEKVLETFNQAFRTAPSIIFIDDIDYSLVLSETVASHMTEARKSSYDVIVTAAATQPHILNSDFVEMFAFCIQLDLPDKVTRMKMVPLIVKHLQGKDLAYSDVNFISDSNEGNSVTELKEFLRKFMSRRG